MTGPVWNGKGTDPWLPERLNARLEVAESERDIRRVVWAQLSGWLVQTGRSVLAGDSRPNPDAIWARVPAWREAVDFIVRGEIRKAFGAAFRRILPGERFDNRTRTVSYLTEVRNRLVRVPEEVYGLVTHEVAVGINLGEGIPKLRDRIDSVLSTTGSDRWSNRATVIARSEVIGALNAGRMEAFLAAAAEEPDVQFETIWLSTDDKRTRPTHVESDGQRVPLGSPFIVGGFQLWFPGDPAGPPQEVIQCVIGSTHVDWPRQAIEGATRRRHSGTFVKILTTDGHDLTVTPNHPVLTPTGYVPAGLLRPGQKVMGTLQPPAPKVGHVPSSAEEVYGAMCQTRKPERVVGSRMDFHGDGSDGEVEVVGTDGYLPTNWPQIERFRQLQKPDLVRLGDGEVALSGASATEIALVPVSGPSDGTLTRSLVGRRGQGAPIGGGHPGETEPVGLTAPPDLQAQLSEPGENRRSADSDFPAHLQYALAAGMTVLEIDQVNRYTSHEWVYNLSTSDHWFTGNGIALHNCRCVPLLVEKGESIDLSNRQFRGGR